jgi:AcrR family transcriptional regulator
MSEQKRELIVAAAAKAFGANGYAATTMEAVAEEAGIAKGSLYNYFDSKENLFKEVFISALAAGEQETDRLLAEKMPAPAKLAQMMDYWAGQLDHYKQIGSLVLEAWAAVARGSGSSELNSAISEAYDRGRDNMVAVIRQGVEEGEFSASVDIDRAASLILGATNGIILQGIMDLDDNVGPGLVESLRDAIIAALTTGPEE